MSSNFKPKTPDAGIADRAVQARGDRLPARDRAQERARGHLCRRAPRRGRRQGPPARARAQALVAGGGDRARPCQLDRAQARLSRPGRSPQAGAGRADRARGVRCGRAGARRGDRRAAHVRRRQEPDRDARRPFPPRQVRRGDRPRRRADRGRAGHAGARAPHRAGAAGGGEAAGRALASADRGPRRQGPQPARKADRQPGAVRRRRPRPARLARHGRGPHLRFRRGGRRGGRSGPPEGRDRRRRRGRARPTTRRPRPTIPPPPARTCRNRPAKRRKR